MDEIEFIKKISDEELLIKKDGSEYVAVPRERFLAREFLSACQQGLVGNVTPSLRAVTVDYKFLRDRCFLHLLAYFDKGAVEEEKEILKADVFGQVVAQMPNISNPKIEFEVKEEITVVDKDEDITPLRLFVFLRDRK